MTTLVNLSTQSYATLTALDGDKYYLYQTPLLARDPFVERAEDAAVKSEDARDESRQARDKAKQWAEETEDRAVEPGMFSAKHHAIKSGKSATASENSNKASANSAGASGRSATASANSAAASSTSASESLTSKNLSKDWANKPEDQKVDTTEYSSKHYSIKSKKEADKAKVSETNAGNSAEAAAGSAAMLEFPFEDQGNFDPRGGNYPAKPEFSALWYCVASFTTPDKIVWGVGDYLCYSKKNDRFSQLTGDPIDPGEQQPFEVPDDLLMQPEKAVRFKRTPTDTDPIYAVGMDKDHDLIYGDVRRSNKLGFFLKDANQMWAVEEIDSTNTAVRYYNLLTSKNGVPKVGGTFTGAVNGVTPTAAAHLTRKDYVNSQDTATLNSAKAYTNTEVAKRTTPATVDAKIKVHTDLRNNPHGVTAAQVQAPTLTEYNSHKNNRSNPHGVTAAQLAVVKKSGDTMTGDLVFYTSQALKSTKDSVSLNIVRQGGAAGQPITVVGDAGNYSTYIYSGSGGIELSQAGSKKLSTEVYGVAITGQLAITAAAPTTSSHATRKDYVDRPSPSVWAIDYGRI